MPKEYQTGISNLDVIAAGALNEKYQDEMTRVLENIYDPNTDPEKARKITIVLTIKPDKDLSTVTMSIDCKSTLAAREPVTTRVFIDKDRDGNVVASEITKPMPGQVTMDGEIIAPKVTPIGRVK